MEKGNRNRRKANFKLINCDKKNGGWASRGEKKKKTKGSKGWLRRGKEKTWGVRRGADEKVIWKKKEDSPVSRACRNLVLMKKDSNRRRRTGCSVWGFVQGQGRSMDGKRGKNRGAKESVNIQAGRWRKIKWREPGVRTKKQVTH